MKKIRAPKWCGPTNPGRHYKPGESGNPKGRAPGSRNKLSEAFFKDLLADWEQHGAAAIERFRDERPHEYVKVVAGVLPRQINMKVNEFDGLTDEQLERQLTAALRDLAAAGFDPFAGAEAEGEPEPPEPLPTLQ
jgi:hypothetical protein